MFKKSLIDDFYGIWNILGCFHYNIVYFAVHMSSSSYLVYLNKM